MSTLAASFRAILTGLQVVIGIVARKEPQRDAVLARIYFHLNRTIQRFEKLVAHWRNNTLPKPCNPRPGRARRPQTSPRLPRGNAWLIRNVDHYNARGHASQLQHFLASEECIKFLADVPRAGRLLRPLAKSLGIQMPGDPPPPPPKPAPIPKPSKTPLFPLPQEQTRAWVRAENRYANPSFYPPEFSKAR